MTFFKKLEKAQRSIQVAKDVVKTVNAATQFVKDLVGTEDDKEEKQTNHTGGRSNMDGAVSDSGQSDRTAKYTREVRKISRTAVKFDSQTGRVVQKSSIPDDYVVIWYDSDTMQEVLPGKFRDMLESAYQAANNL